MINPTDETEHETRKNRINRKLEDAGWKVTRYDESKPLSFYSSHALEEYPTESGPADYALVAHGQILAVIEAKRLAVGPQNVLVQAQRYSKGVTDSPFNFEGFRVPFIYSTNGEIFWFQDVRKPDSRSRKVSGVHTLGALKEMLEKNIEPCCEWFKGTPNRQPHLRPYQIEANDAVEDAICAGKRRMMLAMATGTGKTNTIVSQIYRLMKSGLAKRILFLVDRRALAAQAAQAFATFEAECGEVRPEGCIY